jgi:hypothetical protein
MPTGLAVKIAFMTLTGFVSASALAASCEEAPLTAKQSSFLSQNGLSIINPEGEVAVIHRCDINGDMKVDITDIRAISARRNQPAAHPNDPMDWDSNSIIDVYDARGCLQACSEPRCLINSDPVEEPTGGVIEVAECFQTQDVDNDGEADQVIAITEEETQSVEGPKTLSLVIMREVEGEVKYFKDSFAGKSEDGKVGLHLAQQEPGVIDLLPGSVVIDETATISYQDGEPKILYYWKDGVLRRAPYGVDD